MSAKARFEIMAAFDEMAERLRSRLPLGAELVLTYRLGNDGLFSPPETISTKVRAAVAHEADPR